MRLQVTSLAFIGIALAVDAISIQSQHGHIVLSPDQHFDNLPTAAIVFSPGALVKPVQYQNLLQNALLKSQDVKSKLNLYAVIVKSPLNIATFERFFSKSVDTAVEVLANTIQLKAGENATEGLKLFFAGHSRGAILIQNLVKAVYDSKQLVVQSDGDASETPNLLKYENSGLIMFSAALQRQYRSDKLGSFVSETYPILTVGGTLDGLFHQFRVAECYFHEQLNFAYLNDVMGRHGLDMDELKLTRPVILLEGASHASFIDGALPIFVKLNDMKPQLARNLSLSIGGDLLRNFITYHLLKQQQKDSSAEYILSLQQQSSIIMKPIIESLLLEGSHNLKPACNKLKAGDARLYLDKNETLSKCWVGSKWSELMQAELATLPNELVQPVDIKVNSADAMWEVFLINPVHLPSIHNSSCDQFGHCDISVSTVTQVTYPKVDVFDTGFFGTAAQELRVKFKSIQSIHQSAHVKGAAEDSYFEVVDNNDSICQQLNQRSLDWALSNALPQSLELYNQFGQLLRIASDLGPYNAGPLWIWKTLQFKKSNETGSNGQIIVDLHSPSMRTPVSYPIKLSAGFHYCKLMSPAQALEYITTNSLKKALRA